MCADEVDGKEIKDEIELEQYANLGMQTQLILANLAECGADC